MPAGLFFRRDAFNAVGGMDISLQVRVRLRLWIRLAKKGRFQYLPGVLATSRMHPANKTLQNRREVFRESFRVLRRHFAYVPFQWIYSYAVWLGDRRDQFYEPLRPSLPAYGLSLPLGCWHNRAHPLRYAREWCSVMTMAGAARRWRASPFGRLLGSRR